MSTSPSFARLSHTVRSIAVGVGVMAGVGIPASFGLVAYQDQVAHLSYRTELAAERLAEYIYVQGDTWRFSENRIADMIGFTRIDGRQTVYDAKGRHVADIGAAIVGPTLRVASPIVVHGQSAGKVEAEVSLTPLLLQIGALTLLGIALGGAVFFGALLLPQRALREAAAAHDEVQRDLRLQIEETQSALMVAEEATNAKSAFLAMMSHEIRTPMNAVMGLSSSLQESRLDTEQRHLVDTIYESSNGLLRLLNDILDFSKLDAGKIELETIAFSPAALLDHAVSIVAAKAAEKGLAIRAVTGPDLPGSAGRRSGAAAAGRAQPCGQRHQVHRERRDRGRGALPAAERGRSHDRMLGARYRDRHRAGAHRAAVQRVRAGRAFDQPPLRRHRPRPCDLQAHHRADAGEIEVASTPGAGSTFTFRVTLPTTDAAALDSVAPPSTEGDFATVLSRLARPLMVLLAEDNGTNQLVFSKLMQGFDVDLTIAADGRRALEQARMETFDIVFMDMRMPVMDGLEATRAIRALGGEWSRIPIVALTANAFPEDVRMCREAGMNDFVAKPIRKKVLVERMAAMLADHPVVRAARGSSVAIRADRPARERRNAGSGA